mgnify:CR=1 FL=1
MAVLASIGTGNFTTAGTWGTVDATSYNNTETTTTALTTSYQTSSTFTPGAITISHIGVKLSVRTGTTGTITVALDLAGVDVVGTVVTINTADLPVAATADLNGGWHFFKLASPVLLLAATAYGVKAKTSSASQISLFSTATTNWARALITTTTAAPAAADDLIVAGEYTGAGTSNSFTITMNNTAGTDFGAGSTSLVLPCLAICNKGTLSYGVAASTAYTMRLSGNAIVYSGGTFNMGTVGTEIPRNSTAELFFDCVANVNFGLTVRNLGTFIAQGLSRTSGKDIYYCLLNTDEAVNSTSLGVDTDTGWLNNDVIAVASTTQTITQCEQGTLNGAAGASSLTVDGFAGAGGGLAFAHSGTSPTQAEVILLTRNIVIRGVSGTVQSYVDIKATATFNCKWASFTWLGSATSSKRGIDVNTTTGSFTMQYCSLYLFVTSSSTGVNVNSSSGSNINFSNNVTFSIAGLNYINVATTGTWTVDSNIFMRGTGGTNCVTLADAGGTFTNNRIIGAGSIGLTITEFLGQLVSFSGNIIHSASAGGMTISAISGTLTNTTIYRCGSTGLTFSSGAALDVIFDTLTLFGNSTQNIGLGGTNLPSCNITINNLVSAGDSSFATTNGIATVSTNTGLVATTINNSTFGVASGIFVAHTRDIYIQNNSTMQLILDSCITSGATEVSTQTNMSKASYVASQNHDQVSGVYKTWRKYGTLASNTTTVHTGTTSLSMTPNDASNKLESSGPYGGFKCAVTSGATVTPTVYVYEDASYNGARARLIVKKNISMGISSDTVLDTATASSDAAWEALTGTTATVTADGTLEFVVDIDGTAGNVFVDSFSVA